MAQHLEKCVVYQSRIAEDGEERWSDTTEAELEAATSARSIHFERRAGET